MTQHIYGGDSNPQAQRIIEQVEHATGIQVSANWVNVDTARVEVTIFYPEGNSYYYLNLLELTRNGDCMEFKKNDLWSDLDLDLFQPISTLILQDLDCVCDDGFSLRVGLLAND